MFYTPTLRPGPEEPEGCAGAGGAEEHRDEGHTASLSCRFFQDKVSLELREAEKTWKMEDGSFDWDQMDFLITEYETQNRWQGPEIQTGDAEERAHRTGLKGWRETQLFSWWSSLLLNVWGSLPSIIFSLRQRRGYPESRLNVKSKLQYEANSFALSSVLGLHKLLTLSMGPVQSSPCLPLWPTKDRASTHLLQHTCQLSLTPEPLPIPFLLPVLFLQIIIKKRWENLWL